MIEFHTEQTYSPLLLLNRLSSLRPEGETNAVSDPVLPTAAGDGGTIDDARAVLGQASSGQPSVVHCTTSEYASGFVVVASVAVIVTPYVCGMVAVFRFMVALAVFVESACDVAVTVTGDVRPGAIVGAV